MIRRSFRSVRLHFAASLALVAAPLTRDVAAQSIELTEGRTVQGSLAQGDTARYAVEVGDDHYVFGEVNQITMDVVVRVLDVDGVQRGLFDGLANPRRLEDGELALRRRRLDDITLRAGAEDTFSGGGLTLSFERDRNGVVIGFHVASGGTRDVRFERVRWGAR